MRSATDEVLLLCLGITSGRTLKSLSSLQLLTLVAFDEKNELLGLSYFDASEHEVWIQMITEYEQAARFDVIDALLDATITWAEIHDIPKLAFNLPAARDATELFTFMSNRGFIVRSLGINCQKKVMVRIA